MLSTLIVLLLFGIGGLYIYGQMLEAQEVQEAQQSINNNEAHTQEQTTPKNTIFSNLFQGITNTLKTNLSNASKGFSSLLKGDVSGTISGFGSVVNKNVNPFEQIKTGLGILPENEVTDFIGDVADTLNPVSWF